MEEKAGSEAGLQRQALLSRTPVSHFKYYIHDAVDCCRFQLIGDLSAAHLSELKGCWATANTSLGARKLLLDLRAVIKADESGLEWIHSMVKSGAVLLPEAFLSSPVAGVALPPEAAKLGILSRLVSLVRGSRSALPAQSPTQAQ